MVLHCTITEKNNDKKLRKLETKNLRSTKISQETMESIVTTVCYKFTVSQQTRDRHSSECCQGVYLLSDSSDGWYSDTSVLDVHRVAAWLCRRVLNSHSSIMVVNHLRLHLTASGRVDHVTRHLTWPGRCLVECDAAFLSN